MYSTSELSVQVLPMKREKTITINKHVEKKSSNVEVKSKLIVTLKPNGKTVKDIEAHLHEWFSHLP